jgi:hypothetical protein
MSVSAIGSATSSPWDKIQNSASQQVQDFQGLASAVQSGNLAGAQSALTAFQNDIQANPTGPLATAIANPNSPIGQAYQSLKAAVQSNNVPAAQSAFASLTQDLKSMHHHHHHHKTESTGTQSATSTSGNAPTSSTVGVNLDEQA